MISPSQPTLVGTHLHPPPQSPTTTLHASNSPVWQLPDTGEYLLPDSTLVLGSKEVCETKSYLPLEGISPHERFMAHFYKLCDDAGASKELFDHLLDEMRNAMANGFRLNSAQLVKRKSFMPRLLGSLGLMPTSAIPLTLESGEQVVVHRFQYIHHLQEHLVSPVFAELSNLDLPDPEDPWSVFPAKTDPTYQSFTDAGWYHSYIEDKSGEIDNFREEWMVHPLTLYIDKTGADGIMKNTLEPLVLVSTLLSQKSRQDTNNWIVLGHVPNLEFTSAAKRKLSSSTVRDYHMCLKVLLEPLLDLQRKPKVMEFRRGNQVAWYKGLFPVASILGDNLSNNKLCGRVNNNCAESPRMTRCCLTPHLYADEIPHHCDPVNCTVIRKLSSAALGCDYGVGSENSIPTSRNYNSWHSFLDGLPTKSEQSCASKFLRLRKKVAEVILKKVYGAHAVDNAFADVDFGTTPSVDHATLSDIMHSFEEGIVKLIVDVVLSPMTDSQKMVVDSLVGHIFSSSQTNKSGERANYPRVSFTRGFCNLTLLSADERMGQLFVLSLLMRTQKGAVAMEPRFSEDFDAKRAEASRKRKSNSRDNLSAMVSPTGEEEGGDEEDGEDEDAEGLEVLNPMPELGTVPPNSDSVKHILTGLDLQFLLQERQHYLTEKGIENLEKAVNATVKPKIWNSHLFVATSSAVGSGIADYKAVVYSPPSTVHSPSVQRPRVFTPPNRQHCSIRLTQNKLADLLEEILAFHAFLKYGGSLLDSEENREQYQNATNLVLSKIKCCLVRATNSNQWKLQKFLECMHFYQDHLRFGPSVLHNTDTGERGLKFWGKLPASRAQKRGDVLFKGQVASNTLEAIALQRVSDSVKPPPVAPPVILGIQSRGQSIRIRLRPQDTVALKGKTVVHDFPSVILGWFQRNLKDHLRKKWQDENTPIQSRVLYVQLAMEIVISSGEDKELVRAHHNYQSNGPWNDYVSVKYDEGPFPAKCVCFFKWPFEEVPSLPFAVPTDTIRDKTVLLAQEANYRNASYKRRESLLYEHWNMASDRVSDNLCRAQLTCISVESISHKIFALEQFPQNGTALSRRSREQFDAIVVKDRKAEWPLKFLSIGKL